MSEINLEEHMNALLASIQNFLRALQRRAEKRRRRAAIQTPFD